MQSLYEKYQVWFAVLWIALYCIISANVPGGSDSYWCILFLGIIAVLIIGGIKIAGKMEKYGLSSWPQNSRRFLYFIPLWIFTTSNLWGGIEPYCTGIPLVCTIISMLLVGFNEEMLFRGFLFTALEQTEGFITAVIVSSVSFGIGHIVNLFVGMDVLMTLLQIVYAVALGFMFTMIYYRSRSIWPGVISHALIDVFSYFNNFGTVSSWISNGVVFSGSLLYGVYLLKLPAESERGAES